jgi:hypothetical protein
MAESRCLDSLLISVWHIGTEKSRGKNSTVINCGFPTIFDYHLTKSVKNATLKLGMDIFSGRPRVVLGREKVTRQRVEERSGLLKCRRCKTANASPLTRSYKMCDECWYEVMHPPEEEDYDLHWHAHEEDPLRLSLGDGSYMVLAAPTLDSDDNV